MTDLDQLRAQEPLAALLLTALRCLADGEEEQVVLGELAHGACALFGADDVGILLVDRQGHLAAVASTSDDVHLLELLQLRSGDGPCAEAFDTGETVRCTDPVEVAQRWPVWARRAGELGFASALAAPLRVDGRTIGALNVLSRSPAVFRGEQEVPLRALADAAAILIVRDRHRRDLSSLTAQLQSALDSRVVIEQAKGVVAALLGVTPDAAFDRIRARARSTGTRLHDVARQVVEGGLRP